MRRELEGLTDRQRDSESTQDDFSLELVGKCAVATGEYNLILTRTYQVRKSRVFPNEAGRGDEENIKIKICKAS